MPLEDIGQLDIVAAKKDGTGVMLQIVDAGITRAPDKRMALLKEKVKAYTTWVNSDEFGARFPKAV
jgi:hypothetical protein